MKKIAWLGSIIIFLVSCKSNFKNSITLKKIDMVWLDSIINRSDSSYTKNYNRTDFVTAQYFISTYDSTLLQIMKDSAQQIRKVILTENNIVKHRAQYYANGQLMAAIKFNDKGQLTKYAITYFENGSIASQGNYLGGLKVGNWKEYDTNGNAKIIKYDSSGVVIH